MPQGKSNINGTQQDFVGHRIEILTRFGLAAEAPREQTVEDVGQRRGSEHPAASQVLPARKSKEDHWRHDDSHQREQIWNRQPHLSATPGKIYDTVMDPNQTL